MYNSDWKEDISPDEGERFERLAERLAAVKADRDEKYGERSRALHRYAHTGVQGEVVIRDDLAKDFPPELQVGPFRPGARFRTYVRFSNASWDRRTKDVPDIRAMAIKLVGVSGRKLLSGEESPSTQDFLFNHLAVFSTRTPEEFVSLVEAGAGGSELGMPFRLAQKIGIGRAFAVLRSGLAGLRLPFGSYAGGNLYSMVPFRLGPAAACFSLAGAETGAPMGGLGADLAARLRQGMRWDFRVQLYRDPVRTPIEDPTVLWDAPWVTVGQLQIPATDLESPRATAVASFVERLSYDPWHAVEELRPIGVTNRARRATYWAASAKDRDPLPEPDGSETFE